MFRALFRTVFSATASFAAMLPALLSVCPIVFPSPRLPKYRNRHSYRQGSRIQGNIEMNCRNCNKELTYESTNDSCDGFACKHCNKYECGVDSVSGELFEQLFLSDESILFTGFTDGCAHLVRNSRSYSLPIETMEMICGKTPEQQEELIQKMLLLR